MTSGAVMVSRILPASMPHSFGCRLPSRVHDFAAQHWPRFYDGLEVIRRPKLLASLVLMNFLGWVLDIAIYYAYGHAFNLDIPLSGYITITVALALVTSVPLTFGNIGTWELALVAVLDLFGVPVEKALAFAGGAHLAVSVFNIVLGILATAAMRVAFTDVLRLRGSQARRAAAAEPA
jgi:uncharacterized protein (TIRG00374 family)